MDTIADAKKLLDVAIHAADADDRTDARVRIIAALNERERLREALRELGQYAAALEMMVNKTTEGEPLAKAWAMLNQPETTNTYTKGQTR